MSCRIHVDHPPLDSGTPSELVRSLMVKLGCHPSPHLKAQSSSDSASSQDLEFVWRDPCLFRILAEASDHSSDLYRIGELERWIFEQDLEGQDENLNILIGFTIEGKGMSSVLSEVYYGAMLGADNSRFLLQMIILFLTHDLHATTIRAREKHATEPFFDYSQGTVQVCKIPGWTFRIPADEDYGPTADRDPWV